MDLELDQPKQCGPDDRFFSIDAALPADRMVKKPA
jgi:hypothetical protein